MSGSSPQVHVLYVVYWGAMEPLGRSLVIPAVLELSKIGVDVTLITFEKPADLSDQPGLQHLTALLGSAGVHWQPLRYHKTPKWPATAFDSALATVAALRLRTRGAFDIVHARTFVAGPMGYIIARLLGARLVYHNEGFYPDEQVDGGVWKRGSRVHRFATALERFLYKQADGIIVLSERARNQLRNFPSVANTPVIVVPSAVDLRSFQPLPAPRLRSGGLSLVYLGSVGLRYRLDDAGRFVAAMRRLVPDTRLTVVSRAGRELVESMLDSAGLSREAWILKELPHEEVPAELRLHDAGLFFLTEGLSEHGCSPTKIGEYWASGLPVITTPNVSDTDQIVRSKGVGVVVAGRDTPALEAAALECIELLQDPALSARCRHAAENSYSLEAASVRQRDLYLQLRR